MDGREATITTVVSESEAAQVVEHGELGGRIERRRGVVEQQQPRVAGEGAGEGDALALPARQRDAALADDGVEAVGQVADEAVGARHAECRPHLRRRPSARPTCTLSRTVPPNRNASWNTIARSPGTSETEPVVGRTSPPISSISVVLPAPVAPTNAVTVPASMVTEAPSMVGSAAPTNA